MDLGLSDNTISENDSTTLTGTITDPGPSETFSLNLNWGDSLSPNNTQTFTLGATALTLGVNGINWNPATRVFSLPHQYLDDNPSATTSDNYTVTATVADDDSLQRVLFVSDSDTDLTIPAAFGSGYDITAVTKDFANGNAALLADLSRFTAVVWSSTGSGLGDLAPAAVITNLTNYVTAGGSVFVTGYDSAASPVDANLITFVGGTSVTDTGALPTAIANLATSLTTGVVDIRNVVPANSFFDLDAISGLGPDTVGIVSSSDGFQWTLRALGTGEIAYVSNGANSGSSFDNWLVTTPIGTATYNAAVRNFVSAAATTSPPALTTTQGITVQVSNLNPVAAQQNVSVPESGPVPAINVLTGRTDVGTLDTHTAVAASGTTGFGVPYTIATNGTVTYNLTNQFESVPAGSFGFDSIPFTIRDDDGGTSTSTVAITISGENDAPVATADSYTIAEDNPLSVAAAGVLGNDNDIDNGAALTAILVSGPSHASSFTFNADGSFTYTPAANYNGGDSFRYKANDGTADSNIVTVSLTVTSVVDFDFGDAPASYGIAQHSEGAGFIGGVANTGPLLGTRDFETANQASANADGDDLAGSDDEGGVAFSPTTLIPLLETTITVNATAAGKLDAWIDFNRNSVFDPSEKIASGLNVVAGVNTLNVTIPDTAVPGGSFARFRISTAGIALPTGLASGGEVEDYAVTIGNPEGTLGATLSGSVLTVRDIDQAGKNNDFGIKVVGSSLVISDPVEQFGNAPPGATRSNGNRTLTIPLSSVSTLTVNGNGGSDTFSLGAGIARRST